MPTLEPQLPLVLLVVYANQYWLLTSISPTGQLPLILYASFTAFTNSLFGLLLGLLPGRSNLSSLSCLWTLAKGPNLLSNMLCPHSFLILSRCITPKESLQHFHLCHPRLCFLSEPTASDAPLLCTMTELFHLFPTHARLSTPRRTVTLAFRLGPSRFS